MEILERLPRETARSYAERTLLYNIIHLQLPPGTAISEAELSAQLRCSRTPVREALIELSQMDMVETIPQKGSYITRINYEVLEESGFLRLAAEVAVLELCCKGIEDIFLAKLRGNLSEQEISLREENTGMLMELDNQFHRLLFLSVGKGRVFDKVRSVTRAFDRLRTLSMETMYHADVVEDHGKILDAVCRRDFPSARERMEQHLSRHHKEKEVLMEKYPQYFV